MDYLDCFDRQELIKERARCSSELNQLIIKKEDESVKENVEKVKNSAHYTEIAEPEVKPEVNEEDGISNLFH